MYQVKEAIIKEYWLKKLSGELPKISLPFASPAANLEEGNRGTPPAFSLKREVPEHLADRLKKVSKNSDIGLFILFLSGLSIALSKYTAVEDLIVATLAPSAEESGNGVLFCRNRLSPHMTVKEFIKRTRQEVVEAMDYAEFSLNGILEELQVKNNGGSLNILNAACIYEPFQRRCNILKRFDLVFILTGVGKGLVLELESPSFSGLHSGEIAGKFARNLLTALDRMLENPDREAAALDILDLEEKEELLNDFNDTGTDYAGNKTLHRLFEEQAVRTPDSIAVIGRGAGKHHAVSYRELNKRVDRLSHLLQVKGVKSESIVGIMPERSVEMMVGILGILKAGGAYLPIDTDYPSERVHYMFADSGAKILLVMEGEANKVKEEIEVIKMNVGNGLACSEENSQPSPAHATSLAYVTYTSGSTGKPKGVMIEHRSVINFIKGITDIIPFSESDRILSLTTITFDIFGLETLVPLTAGSKVVVGNREEQLSTASAVHAIEREGITIFQLTPSRLQLLMADPGISTVFKSLGYLLVGGEAFPEPLLEKVRSLFHGKIYNLYGPTETTIWSAVKDVGGRKALNIGKPIANTRIYILDKTGGLQPIGVPGELCIGGDGLSRGYLNRPELTKEKFRIVNYKHTAYIYKTGDLARWLPDGNLEFLGRIDHQVKIRGFRIELEEIENQLQTHDSIKEAVVIPKEPQSGNKYLCAYVVLYSADPGKFLNVSRLREFLSPKLPDYMIPSYFVPLEKIPLTPNGKVDRKALPEDQGHRMETGVTYVAPGTETEKIIARHWQEVLQSKEKVGIEDNFFDLGGNSFKLIQLNTRLNEALETHIPVMAMVRYPTIKSLAHSLNREDPASGTSDAYSGSPEIITDHQIDESLEVMDEAMGLLESVMENGDDWR